MTEMRRGFNFDRKDPISSPINFKTILFSTNLKDHGGSGIPCRTSGPQAIASTEQDDFLDQFGDEPPCSRSLWMAIDHRISIIVHPVDIHSHHFGHIDVIHDKGAVRLYGLEVFYG